MSLESVINECNSEIIIENKIIDQASKLLSLKNVWPGKSYLILVSENMVTEVMLYSRFYLVFFFIPPPRWIIKMYKNMSFWENVLNSDWFKFTRDGHLS